MLISTLAVFRAVAQLWVVSPHEHGPRQDSIVQRDFARAYYRCTGCSCIGAGLHLVLSDDTACSWRHEYGHSGESVRFGYFPFSMHGVVRRSYSVPDAGVHLGIIPSHVDSSDDDGSQPLCLASSLHGRVGHACCCLYWELDSTCGLTNRSRQRGMALSVPLRGSRWLVPRA